MHYNSNPWEFQAQISISNLPSGETGHLVAGLSLRRELHLGANLGLRQDKFTSRRLSALQFKEWIEEKPA